MLDMEVDQDFDGEKQAVIERVRAVDEPLFFAQLDVFAGEALEDGLTKPDERAIAEGVSDVEAGRVETWEEFREGFGKWGKSGADRKMIIDEVANDSEWIKVGCRMPLD